MINNLKDHINLLDEVKNIDYIYDNFLTLSEASNYYEVPKKTISTIMERNFNEFESEEIKIIDGLELRELKIKYKNKINNKTSKLTLINKTVLLKLAFMLQESLIANQLKEKTNVFIPRKEIIFKDKLDLYLNILKDEYKNRRKEISLKNNVDLRMFDYETQKCFNDNRVDFYFPYMKLVVEYDEKYHSYNNQNFLDLRRESEIILNMEKTRFGYFEEQYDNINFHYIPDAQFIYFDSVKNKEYNCCEKSKKAFQNNRENYICEDCGYADISKIEGLGTVVRIKYGEEDMGLIKLFSYIMSEAVGF